MKTPSLKNILYRIRSIGTFYIAKQTLEHLEAIRNHELGVALTMLPTKGKFLIIGAGAGWQARALEAQGYEVSAIDLASSNYRDNMVWPVTVYDGKTIPFEDHTFDIVYSSNVLEHIPHIYEFQKEILRVAKPDACVLHILPSSNWRFWTIISNLLKWSFPKVHGEHAGNPFTEIYYFSRRHWTKLFRETGWAVETQDTTKLFYTGCSIMDARLSINTRRKLSRVFGSSCNVFILQKDS